ncbi:MAG: calcium-binding protein [Rickettsiales bacterium]
MAGDGANVVEGGDGNDTLDGGNEVDQLTGGADADTLTGGAGADTFIFLATTDSSLANIDIITDFSTLEDTIDLTALGALDYIDSAAFSGAANEVRWEIDAPNNRTLVEVDTTADGIADMRVELTGQFGMNYGHFVGAVTDASSPGTFVLTIGNDDMGYDNGTDLFQTTAANFAAADTLVGGFGTDVLEFLDTITITAADWANKDSIEVLQFDAGGSTVEITNTFVNSSYSDDVEIDNQGFAITLDTSDLTGARDVFISGTGTVTLADGAHNRNVKTTTNVAVDIDGGTGNDEIFGANKNDVITGGLGNDTISAGNGSNTIDGGDGNDRLITGSGADDIIGGDGNDNITAGNGADDIDAGDGNDTINSGRHNDTVLGGDGDDVINGERENDSIDGGAGNDTITGERHIDTLTGGTGDDIFVFSANNHSTTGANRDLITDFNNTIETDTIDVSAFGGVFSFLVGGNGIADFTGAQEIAWEQTGGDTLIYVDSNGNGSANFEIGLAGLVNLTAADFVL